jgi:hypothetical protein
MLGHGKLHVSHVKPTLHAPNNCSTCYLRGLHTSTVQRKNYGLRVCMYHPHPTPGHMLHSAQGHCSTQRTYDH